MGISSMPERKVRRYRQHIEVAANVEPIQQVHAHRHGLRAAEIGPPIEITPEQCE